MNIIAAADGEELALIVLAVTDSSGAGAVIDLMLGTSSTLVEALKMGKTGDDVVVAASKTDGGAISCLADEILKKPATLRGVRGHDPRSVEPALRLIVSGRYPLEAICTHTYVLDELDAGL